MCSAFNSSTAREELSEIDGVLRFIPVVGNLVSASWMWVVSESRPGGPTYSGDKPQAAEQQVAPTPTRELDQLSNFYRGVVMAVGTRHDKARFMVKPFRRELGTVLLTPPELDTDQFGTFTGTVTRRGTPAATARAKAILASQVSGLPVAVATEASYFLSPVLGWGIHEELMLVLDRDRGIEIIEGERLLSELPAPVHVPSLNASARCFLFAAGLGTHAVTVHPAHLPARMDPATAVRSGLTDLDEVAEALTDAAGTSMDGRAVLRVDLRAHHNPARQQVITRLAARMARRLATGCPACGTPGFGRTHIVGGLPCAQCGHGTDLAAADVHSCPMCTFTRYVSHGSDLADAGDCSRCNP